VWSASAQLVVVKPGANGSWRWQPVWRQFPDGEGDGGSTDGGRVGRGPRTEAVVSKESWNGGGGIGMGVAAAKGSWRWQCARETKFCQEILSRKASLQFIGSSISSSSTWSCC
jgi:hypothetical protein